MCVLYEIGVRLLLAGTVPFGSAAAWTLRVGGTGTAIGMLQQVGAEFTAATGVKVDVVSSLGSTGAIRALTDGVLDITVPAQPNRMNPPPTCAKSRCCETRT